MRFPELFLLFSSKTPRTIRFRIISLVALIVIPLIALFVWMAVNFASAKRDLIELQRFDMTARLSSEIDQEIARHLGMLHGLAGSEDLKRLRLSEFEQQATVLSADPRVLRLWAFDRKGAFVAGAPAATSAPPTVLDVGFVDRVFAGGHAVSSVQGSGREGATVFVAMPVFENETVVYGLVAEVSISGLSDTFSAIGMDKDWAGAVVDQRGNYVARSISPEERIGQAARPELRVAAQGEATSGIFDNVTWEGLVATNAFLRSGLTGWTSVVAVPQADLIAPLRNVMFATAAGALAILMVTLIVASFMASKISEPVRDLSRYASALAGGRTYEKVADDIAELEEVRDALDSAMAKNARLAAIVASSSDAILSVELDGTIGTWNQGAEELFGFPPDEIVGKPKSLIVPEDRLDEFEQHRSKVLNGESVRAESVRCKKDGTRVDVSVNSAPIRRPDGSISGISSIIHDISDRKSAEDHRKLLIRELAHRSKNQLAIIQSIAQQTGNNAESIPEFLNQFRGRLQGFAVSHDLLANQDWRGVTLSELVQGQLEIFVGSSGEQVEISGPPIRLSAAAAESIGLALHELATNAVKHGALSVPTGRVEISWSTSAPLPDRSCLTLEWKESGGPKIQAPPSRTGFGSRIIGAAVASAVSGQSDLQFAPDGLQWRLEFALPA